MLGLNPSWPCARQVCMLPAVLSLGSKSHALSIHQLSIDWTQLCAWEALRGSLSGSSCLQQAKPIGRLLGLRVFVWWTDQQNQHRCCQVYNGDTGNADEWGMDTWRKQSWNREAHFRQGHLLALLFFRGSSCVLLWTDSLPFLKFPIAASQTPLLPELRGPRCLGSLSLMSSF